jgi:hypothetical protein
MAGIILLLPFILGFVIYFIIIAGQRLPGMMMKRRLTKLGTPVGRSLDEITQLVGPPQATSHEGEDRTLCQWITSSYHIALMFSGNHCIEIVRIVNH